MQLCQNAIHGSTTLLAEYLVPEIADTIELLRSQRSTIVPPTANQCRIMALCDVKEDPCLAPYGEEDLSEDFCNLIINEEGESPFARSFRPDH